MTKTVIVDAGYWVALYWPSDENHAAARDGLTLLRQLTPATTWPVVTESAYLLGKYQGVSGATQFLDSLHDSGTEIFNFNAQDVLRMTALMRRYQGLPMDLADASLVLLAEALGHGRILTTDRRDFGVYRWKSAEPFHNLLKD